MDLVYGLSYILGGKPSREYHAPCSGGLRCYLPVKSLAGASGNAFPVGVEQYRRDRERPELVEDRGVLDPQGFYRAKPDSRAVLGRLVTVELDAAYPGRLGYVHDLCRRFVHEYADGCHEGRQLPYDEGRGPRVYIPRSLLVKDEADGVRAKLGRHERVLKVCYATYLDPDLVFHPLIPLTSF